MRTRFIAIIDSDEPDYPLLAIAEMMETIAKNLRDKMTEWDTELPESFNEDLEDILDGHKYSQARIVMTRRELETTR